ncbi:MAG TPA: hypothetical protein VJJ72_03130, partial [Candidatus Paceibacterota bacterium]
ESALLLAKAWQRTNINDHRIFTVNPLGGDTASDREEALAEILQKTSTREIVVVGHLEDLKHWPTFLAKKMSWNDAVLSPSLSEPIQTGTMILFEFAVPSVTMIT